MDKEIIPKLADKLFVTEFKAGDVVMWEGEVGLCCYIIYKGKIDLYINEHHIATINEDTIFGEAALNSEVPLLRSATAIA